MSIFYKKYNSIPSLPTSLSKECIKIANDNIDNKNPMEFWYRELEFKNTNSLSYATPDDKLENTGGVGLYRLPLLINNEICNYYKKTNTKLSTYVKFYIQVSTGGNFVAPHVDPGRVEGFLYLLQSGGKNVRTKW
jgi:hypothetical protein